MYPINNAAYNPIGTKGCKYLSKGQWDKL